MKRYDLILTNCIYLEPISKYCHFLRSWDRHELVGHTIEASTVHRSRT